MSEVQDTELDYKENETIDVNPPTDVDILHTIE